MVMTKEERDTLKALSERAKAEDEADAKCELWVRRGDHEIKLTGSEARAFKAKFGITDEEAESSSESDALETEQEPADKGGYGFAKRKK